jgi:hypothetical protein
LQSNQSCAASAAAIQAKAARTTNLVQRAFKRHKGRGRGGGGVSDITQRIDPLEGRSAKHCTLIQEGVAACGVLGVATSPQ